jgi:hypothetical protein
MLRPGQPTQARSVLRGSIMVAFTVVELLNLAAVDTFTQPGGRLAIASPAKLAPGSGQPGYAKWFFRTLVPAHEPFDQKVNTGDVPETIFNPQAMSR